MRETKRVLRSFVLVLSVFSLLGTYGSTSGAAWSGIPQVQAQVVDPDQDPGGDGIDGGVCPNTLCFGVSSCRYQAHYKCSMTKTPTCTNAFC